jgi:hypothetical protein
MQRQALALTTKFVTDIREAVGSINCKNRDGNQASSQRHLAAGCAEQVLLESA